MHRLFVAIRPPPEIRGPLLTIMGGLEGARWQDDAQLHLTLRFIGDVDGRTADDAAAALAQVHAKRFEIALSGVGSFDRRARIDTLWAGVAPHDALAHLHRKIDRALVAAGLPPERRVYLPHITLARAARGQAVDARPFLEAHAGLTSAPFAVKHFGLYESHLAGTGAIYELVERYPLGIG